ncbi:unnamed protein product [Durusdinium trenchii]|uniref:FCP1 homology domain-containing protein n=1 Tax=Durusdinium trenchii TaxID=1381693 RepID=A0ABP0I2R2_9DINO
MTTCPSSPRRSFTRAAYRCQCLERTLQDETFPVKVVAFDFDETLTLITYLIEDGDSEEVQKQIVKTNFQTPWVKGSRIEHLQSMLKALAISKSGKRRALAVLTKNYAGAKAVHNLLHVSGLASCFDAIWALPTGGLYRCKDEWHEMCTPNVCHKADLLALVAESPHEFFPQLGSDAFEDMGPLKMEGIVLVDDQRANFQSPSGNQVLRFCKVARYDGYYRNLGYVKNMGGIGAHCFEDYETLKMFVEEPSTYKETLHLHCVERHFERSSEQHPVELIIFDFDETLTLATFMPSDPTFEEISWDLPSLEGSDWTAEDLLTYNFESPFCSGSRLQALKAMLEDLSKRYVLAILSRNDRGAVAVLNLLRLAQLADFFAAIWTMPFRQQVSCGAWKADAAWHVFEAPLLEVPDEKTEILYHIVENSGKWFPQMEGRLRRLQGLRPESVMLVDDEKENLQSASRFALRYCKVARYDDVYRNCGPLNQLGGIGAHSFEDFELLRRFAEAPWEFQEPHFPQEEADKPNAAPPWEDSRVPSRSEELVKLPRSRLRKSASSPTLRALGDLANLPGPMSRSQSFCLSDVISQSPRTSEPGDDQDAHEICLTGMDDSPR